MFVIIKCVERNSISLKQFHSLSNTSHNLCETSPFRWDNGFQTKQSKRSSQCTSVAVAVTAAGETLVTPSRKGPINAYWQHSITQTWTWPVSPCDWIISKSLEYFQCKHLSRFAGISCLKCFLTPGCHLQSVNYVACHVYIRLML